MLACLAKITPIYRLTGERADVRVSSINDAVNGPKVNGMGGQIWEPALVTSPVLSLTMWNGDFNDAVSVGNAGLVINTVTLKKSFPFIDDCAWIGAQVEIYAERPGTAWPWRVRFAGKVSGFSRKGDSMTLGCEIDTEPFEADVLTATYAGTGGAEGLADLKGRVKPLAIGRPKNVEPVLINAVDNVYQFSGYGPVEAVSALYERGASFGTAIGNYASYTALVAATVPAGRWATCLAEGMVRLGAPAAGLITADVRGHVVGSASPRLTGAVIQALAELAGVEADRINTIALDALDIARAFPTSLYLTDQTSVLDIARSMALCCNYQSGIGLDGRFTTFRISFDQDEGDTIDAQGRSWPQVREAEELDVSPPFWRTVIGANQCWRVHTLDEVAFFANLNPRGRYDPAESYREGDMVDMADGSQWLYINPVASIGNNPPTWPTTSDSFWKNLTPSTDPESIGAATADAVAQAYALAAARGKVWTTPAMPTVAESNVGDTWIAADGTFYDRANDGGILLGGFAITLAGFRPRIAWTLAANQVLRDTLALADVAYTNANDAIDQLIGLADDGLLSRNEKITKLVPESARLADKWASLSSIATSLAVSTATASSARAAWLAFLAGLVPAWNDTTQDTFVSRAAFDVARDDYDTALYDLDRAIKAKAATAATWAGVSGTGGQPTGNDVAATISPGGGVAANQVNTLSVVSGALSGTTIVSASGSSAAFADVRELAYVTIPTLDAGTVGIRLGLYGQIKDVGSGYTPGYPMLRLYRVSAANAAAYLASSPRNPSVQGVPMNRNITLPNWSNIDMGGTLLFNTTTPAAGDLYVLGIDVVTNPPSAGSWAWNWRADIALDIVKR